jgi:polyphosphate kinase
VELRRYVHLSTGNYNASTAKLYTDLALFTADAAIGEDATELFNALSGFSRMRTSARENSLRVHGNAGA